VTHDAANIENETARSKWLQTFSQFLDLAKNASKNFDYERALKYLESMEELWETKGLPIFSLEIRFELHSEKGRALAKLGRYSEAVLEYEKLQEFCQDKKLIPRRVEVFLEIGQLLAKSGEHDKALGYIHRALSGYRRLHDPLGICKSLRNLGAIYIDLGEFEDAEAAYEEAIEISLNDRLHLLYADLNNNLGTIKNVKGDWRSALDCYYKAKDVYDSEGEVRKKAYALNNIGITFMEQEQYDNARESFLSALQVAGTVKDESLMIILNINLTDMSLKLGHTGDARQYCTAAERNLSLKGLKNSQLAETRKLSGKIAVMEKDYDNAMRLFNEALDFCDELGLQFLEAEVLYEKGELLLITEKHMEALQVLERAFRQFHQVNAAGRVKKTEELIDSIEKLYLKVFEAMAFKVDRKDPYTKGHSDRVASLALMLSQKLGLADQEIKEVVAGALLHDIGKLQVPSEVLKKKGKLTAEEFEEIKKHPDYGIQLLTGITLPWDVIPLIRHHHEKIDGSGYPSGLEGEMIPSGARIICVADVFDALTSERPYRKAFSPEKAIDVMQHEMTGSFDPVMLDTFTDLIESGQADHIINRKTDPDEMYHIWAQCRFSDTPVTVE